MRYRLVIFDLDGTLADTADDIASSLLEVLVAEGLAPIPRDRIVASIGGGVRKLVERCLPDATLELRRRVVERFMEVYGASLLVRTRLYPGVRETLEALDGVAKAVVSNKPEAMSRKILEGLGILGFISAVYGGDSLPTRKPDPAAVHELMRRMGARKEEVLLVGDSGVDVDTARAAGIDVCAVTYGYHQPGELDGVARRIDRFSDLPAVIRAAPAGGGR